MAWLAGAGVAAAQPYVSGSAALVSDYRWHGYSMSDRRPTAQATLAFDHSSGAYAGVFASGVRLGAGARRGVQSLGYVGYAARTAGGLSWDASVAYSEFSRPNGYGFGEYRLGVSAVDWSARLSYAPRYFNRPYAATYAELNFTPGAERELVPVFHVGLLHSDAPAYFGLRRRWDGRIGLAYNVGLTTAQVSWGTASSARSTPSGAADRSAWVVRLTRWL